MAHSLAERMKMRLFVGALAIALSLIGGPAEALPFQPGEQLQFNVSFLAVPVGSIRITVEPPKVVAGVRVWPLDLRAHTSGLTDAVYKIDEQFVTMFDPVTQRSIESTLRENTGHYHSVEVVRFLEGKAKIHSEAKGVAHEREEETPIGATDILAALYSLRSYQFRPEETYRIPIFTGYKNWEMLVTPTGREKLKTQAGQFDTVVLRCRTMFTGKFATEREVTIWISTGAHHIPVRIEAPFVLGTMRADLASYDPGSP